MNIWPFSQNKGAKKIVAMDTSNNSSCLQCQPCIGSIHDVPYVDLSVLQDHLVQASAALKNRLYLKIADTFFKLKNYKRSISFYAKTIAASEGDEVVTWANFQVAQSYEKLGIHDKGLPIYSRLKNGTGGLIRALSAQKAVELAPRTEGNASP